MGERERETLSPFNMSTDELLPLLTRGFEESSDEEEEEDADLDLDPGGHDCGEGPCARVDTPHYIASHAGVTGTAFQVLTRGAQDIMTRAGEAMQRDVSKLAGPGASVSRKRKCEEDFIRLYGKHLRPSVMGPENEIWRAFSRVHCPPHRSRAVAEKDEWDDRRVLFYLTSHVACDVQESWTHPVERTCLVMALVDKAVEWGLMADVVFRTMESLDALVMTPLKLEAVMPDSTLCEVGGCRTLLIDVDMERGKGKEKDGWRVRALAVALLYNFAGGGVDILDLIPMVTDPECVVEMSEQETVDWVRDAEEVAGLTRDMFHIIRQAAKDLQDFCAEREKVHTLYGVALDICRNHEKDVRDCVKVLSYMLCVSGIGHEYYEGCNQHDVGVWWHWPDKHTTAAGILLLARYRLHKKSKWSVQCQDSCVMTSARPLLVAKRIHARTVSLPRKVNVDWQKSATELLDVSRCAWSLVRLSRAEAHAYPDLMYDPEDNPADQMLRLRHELPDLE